MKHIFLFTLCVLGAWAANAQYLTPQKTAAQQISERTTYVVSENYKPNYKLPDEEFIFLVDPAAEERYKMLKEALLEDWPYDKSKLVFVDRSEWEEKLKADPKIFKTANMMQIHFYNGSGMDGRVQRPATVITRKNGKMDTTRVKTNFGMGALSLTSKKTRGIAIKTESGVTNHALGCYTPNKADMLLCLRTIYGANTYALTNPKYSTRGFYNPRAKWAQKALGKPLLISTSQIGYDSVKIREAFPFPLKFVTDDVRDAAILNKDTSVVIVDAFLMPGGGSNERANVMMMLNPANGILYFGMTNVSNKSTYGGSNFQMGSIAGFSMNDLDELGSSKVKFRVSVVPQNLKNFAEELVRKSAD